MHNSAFRTASASFWTALCVACTLTTRTSAVPLTSFYYYPRLGNETELGPNDDGFSSSITLSPAFPFFGTNYSIAYVNNNGVVSFNEPLEAFDADPFPLNGSFPMLTPYWGDVDTSGTGMVWYLQTNNSELLTMARNDVLAVYTHFDFFNPTSLLIATWDHVGYFDAGVDLTNTFQCILITDGIYSFAIFLYGDDLIQWSRGDVSEVDAQVGFNAGDEVRHLTINGSRTPAIVDIETTSNVDIPGKYFFRVDAATIVATPPAAENQSPLIINASAGVATGIRGESQQFTCIATGLPVPTASWLNGNAILTSNDKYTINSTTEGSSFITSTLTISSLTLTDTSIFSCSVTNSEGTTSFNFSLTVEGAPVFLMGPTNTTITVGHGDFTSFTFILEAFPPPTYITLRRNEDPIPIPIISTEQVDNITTVVTPTFPSVDYSDGGLYTIEASNTQGSTIRTFILHITPPPGIVLSPMNQEIVVNSTLTVECSTNISSTITWRFESAVLLNGGRYSISSLSNTSSLTIANIMEGDSGTYSCTAAVGNGTSVSANFNVTVLPIQILFFHINVDGEVNGTSVINGSYVTFLCVAFGVPEPELMWKRNGELTDLPISSVPTHAYYIGEELTLGNVGPEDGGEYSCVASNEGGTDSASIQLHILVPPQIVLSPSDAEIEAGNNVSLTCTAEGTSLMYIRWTKGDTVLINDPKFTITTHTPNNFTLTSELLFETMLDDTGLYSCTAVSAIGNDTSFFNLIITMPPTIESAPLDTEVVIGNSVSIFCSASGVPLPNITWSRADHGELMNHTDYLIVSMQDDDSMVITSLLTIVNPVPEDTGYYNCTAENNIGRDSATFHLQVQEPPEIVEVVGPEVIVGETAELQCTAFGVPAPRISWETQGTVLRSGERINITEGGSTGNISISTLTISNVTLSDDGQFTCVADNGVGSPVNSSVILRILFLPEISTPFDNVEVVVGSNITLTCSASGFHRPDFNWTLLEHSGRRLNFMTNIVNETYVTSQVELLNTSQADTGNYSCIAGNNVGEAAGFIFLQVLEPPEIVEVVGPEVVVGETAELQCTAFGVPAPRISWETQGTVLRSGERINITEGGSTGNILISTLTISNVALSDDGQFTCVADNGVGSPVNSSLHLTILFPPTLSVSSEFVEVVAGSNVSLTCSAIGFHLPNISWSVPDPLSDRITISHNVINDSFIASQLDIFDTEQTDTGNYSCTAENGISNDTGYIFLQVLEPAMIVRHTQDLDVVIADSVAVYCEVTGVYRPSITWTRDDDNDTQTVQNTSRVTISESIGANGTVTSTLTIDVITRSDAGKYSCRVANGAGSDEASFQLNIQEPALVIVHPDDVVIPAGDSVLLTCIGYGMPAPSISWQKNGENLTDSRLTFTITETNVFVEDTVFVKSVLLLCNVSDLDSGHYTCTADNVIQRPSMESFSVVVQSIPPVIVLYPEDTYVTTGNTVCLACTAFGAPLPSVVWSWDGDPVPANDSSYRVESRLIEVRGLYMVQSILHVCGFSLLTMGDYTCSVENYVAETSITTELSLEVPANVAVAPNDTSAYVGDSLTLSCVGYGSPLPTVTWMRNGQPLRQPYLLNETEIVIGHVTFVRSILYLCSLKLADDDRYTCTASNNFSTSMETFALHIKVKPQIVLYPNTSEFLAGSMLLLSCVGYGIPQPHVVWSKDGLDLQTAAINDSRISTWDDIVIVGRHIFTPLTQSYLRICSTAKIDSGLYKCSAVTDEGETAVEFGVTVVEVPPALLRFPVDVDIIAGMGQSIVASCIAYGSPAPEISWSLHQSNTTIQTIGTDMPDSSVHTRQFVRNGVGIVYSSLLLCPSHSGALTTSQVSCSASNGVDGGNMTSHSFLINVTAEPVVLDETTEYSGLVGRTFSLSCIADGVPLPDITWLKDDCPLTRHIELSSRIQTTEHVIQGFRVHVPEAKESTLTVEESMEHDSGLYSCRATNTLGTASPSDAHHVTVNASPASVDICNTTTLCLNGGTCVTRGNSHSCICLDGWTGAQCDQYSSQLSPPVLLKSPQTTFAQHLVDVVFECDVIGNPEPVITWYRDGLEIIGATQKMLVIVEVDLPDRATYYCTAVNSLGNVTSEEAYLNIRGMAQYEFSVGTDTHNLSIADKWFDTEVEESVIVIGNGSTARVLCIGLFNQTLGNHWAMLITLQSEDVKLAEVVGAVTDLFDRVREELGITMYINESKRTDGCLDNVTTVKSHSFTDLDMELFWTEQPFGGLAELLCPCDAVSLPFNATRRCAGSFGGVVNWMEPDQSQCDFSDTTRILCSLPDIEQLPIVTNRPNDFSSMDVYLGAVNVELAASKTSGNALTSDDVLSTIDNLISASVDVLRSSQEDFSSSSIILDSLNRVLDGYPLPTTPPLEIFQDTFVAVVDFNFNLDTFTGSSTSFPLGKLGSGSGSEDDITITSSVSISSDLASILEGHQYPRIVFTIFTSEGLFLEREEYITENNRTTLVLGSYVMGAQLSEGLTVSDIEAVITLSFGKNEKAMENGSVSICVFWNQTMDEGYGAWSEEGCRLVHEDKDVAICSCDHLTSFALLVDTSPEESSPTDDRNIATWVYSGCIFSAVLMLLTIMTYAYTKYQWRSIIGVFLINMCTAHILLNLIFIGSYNGHFSEKSCPSLAAGFHYLFLVAALSLTCLALTTFRRPGEKRKQISIGLKCCIILSGILTSWILPAVIVSLAVGLSRTYTDDNSFCRPVGGAFNYGLVLPWALVHLLLCLVLLLLPCLCFFRKFRKRVTSSWVREYTGVFLAVFLFNIGWGFGLPATHPLHIGSLRFYAQIVFVVANGGIGLVLFFFFCIMSKNVRQTYSVVVILRLLKRSSGDWQKKSRLYKSSKEVNEMKVVETREEVVKEEEDFDLNEVHGNPAVVEDSTFELETQFN